MPLYNIMAQLHLLDSYGGLILAYCTIAVPFCAWMLKGYFDTIPRSIDEAGLVDGLTPFGTFWRLIMPLARPGLAVTAFYSFLTAWGEVAYASLFLQSNDHYTLAVGMPHVRRPVQGRVGPADRHVGAGRDPGRDRLLPRPAPPGRRPDQLVGQRNDNNCRGNRRQHHKCCHRRRHRTMVARRGHLRGLRAQLRRRQRRRRRRPAPASASQVPVPRRPRRRRALADAVLPLADGRRRLRRGRLPRRRPDVRHARRLRRADRRPRTRTACGSSSTSCRTTRLRAHAWFVEALAAPAGSAARDRYLFRPGRGASGELPPNDWESIFGGPAWTRTAEPDGTPGEWYLHLFDSSQPDLNWDNPEVHAEFEDVLRFWLDRGVDGFRIDVAHGMVKAPGPARRRPGQPDRAARHDRLPYFDQDGVHDDLPALAADPRRVPGRPDRGRRGVGADVERLAHYVRPDELHQAFNFHYLGTPWDADALRAVIDRVARRRRRGRRTDHLGAVQPRRPPARHALRRRRTRPRPGPRGRVC